MDRNIVRDLNAQSHFPVADGDDSYFERLIDAIRSADHKRFVTPSR
jgi:hypothetical protein